jgi:hypothetical protein
LKRINETFFLRKYGNSISLININETYLAINFRNEEKMKFKKEREEDKIDGCELFFIVVHFSHDISFL